MTDQAPDRVDVAAVVADIEAEVARRRAAGEYPEDLLDRLAVEFHDVADERVSLEDLAHVETVRPLVSARAGLGSAVVFAKKVLRRAMAWYVRPLAEDQSRFNYALLREVRALGERIDGLDSAWRRPATAPPRESGAAAYDLTAQRLRLLDTGSMVGSVPAGPVLVLWWADDALLRALVEHGFAVETATRDARMAADARAAGVRVHDSDALHFLQECGPTMGAVLGCGLLPMLAPTETLALVPVAAAALRENGLLYLDAPQPGAANGSADPALIDAGYRRFVSADTVTLLCEASGLRSIAVESLGTAPWYAVTARRTA